MLREKSREMTGIQHRNDEGSANHLGCFIPFTCYDKGTELGELKSAHGGLKTEFPDSAAELEVLPERFLLRN